MVAAVATVFQPDALAGRAGEGPDHIRADSLIAGMVERSLGALGVEKISLPNATLGTPSKIFGGSPRQCASVTR
jgi:hypothetical protein